MSKKKKGKRKNVYKNNANRQMNKETTSIESSKDISLGRSSYVSKNSKRLTENTRYVRNILTELNGEANKYKAMDILVDKTPFGKMALNVYTTITNPDGEYTFVNPKTGKRNKKIENEWKTFEKRRFMNNDAGLDGICDLLARSNYTRGDMAIEIIVNSDATDISTIAVIDPMTFKTWEWVDSENRYAIYQQRDDGKKVDLYSGNFMRFPYQPNISNPFGTLPFEPAIQVTMNYYQHMLDATTILNRIGYPRYKMTIDAQSVLELAKPNEKDTFAKRNELFNATFDSAERQFKSIGRDSDIITFDSNTVDIMGGTANVSGLDLRAWFEMDSVELCNAYGLPRIYLNSEEGGSYALGSAEQQILVDRVDNSRDNIVAIKEAIGTMWCRVHGFNAVCKFNQQPLEWEKMTEKWTAKLKELEYWRRQQEYGYVLGDDVANRLNGSEKAITNEMDRFAYLTSSGETATEEESKEEKEVEKEGEVVDENEKNSS